MDGHTATVACTMGLIPESSPSGSDGVTSVDVDSDEEKPPAASNTRVKIIPVSAIPPATQSPVPIQSSTGTTRLSSPQITTYYESDVDARRTSQVHPSGTTRRSSSHRRSFLHRRMDVWDTERDISTAGSSRKLGAGSISALPVAVQASFRRKVLMIFDLQLLLLTGIMCLLTYNPPLSSLLHRVFYSEYILLIALGAMVAALFVLYRIHSLFPWNWIAMVVFTGVFSVLIAGVQVVLKTHAGVFCCAFTFLAMSVMTLLCGVKRSNGTDTVFLSALVAGFVSYAVVAVGSAIVFGALEWHFVTPPMFAYALVLEFALIMWFSYDAITIFRLITPDEYMHGVIYFYTDVLVLTMISVAAIALVLLCTACGGAGGGGAGFGYINPTGCSSGCCGCCGDGGMEGEEGEDDVSEIADTAAQNQTIERG